MPTQIFVNLPVRDLAASMAFFREIGFSFDRRFTDETAACMVVEEPSIYVMLLTEEKFRSFSPHPIADAKMTTGMLIALSRPSRDAVDEIVRSAVAAGGTVYSKPQDHGFMYQHGFQDLDGHVFEVFWMDPAALAGMECASESSSPTT